MIYFLLYLLIGLFVGHALTKFLRVYYDFWFMFWAAIIWPIFAVIAIIGFSVDWLNKHL